MNYLFFDIECANCDNGVGKICSFGYVLCDSDFNVLEKKDLLINPNAKFSYGVFSKKYITLGYPPSQFLSQPKFDVRYPTIRDLLTQPDQIVIGHAVDNDVNFLLGDCDRYRLPVIEYDFYDSQELYRVYTKCSLHKNLTAICEELDITLGNAHRSDEDAEMTMQVVKKLCEQQNLELPKLLEKFPTSHHKMRDLIAKHNIRKQFFLFKQFLTQSRMEKTIENNIIKGKTFCFSRKVEALDYGKTANLIQQVLDSGGYYSTDIEKADFFVRGKGGCDRLTKALAKSSLPIITLNFLCKMLEVDYALIPTLNMSKYLAKQTKETTTTRRKGS
ncbi:MAG TPA: 3'-5' exonuclease, partial [Clostridia bacterium]|nr:3'-5' exonuclease [Clostridia bacterium]